MANDGVAVIIFGLVIVLAVLLLLYILIGGAICLLKHGGKTSGFVPWGGKVPEWKYKFYPGKIILNHSMDEYGGQLSLPELKEKCDLYTECKGYDSLGQLIDYIPPQSAWTKVQSLSGGKINPNEGTYLKRAAFRESGW